VNTSLYARLPPSWRQTVLQGSMPACLHG